MLLPLLLLLQANIRLFPTVGLQTPGELIEANFGTKPFLFDFASMLKVGLCKRALPLQYVCVCLCVYIHVCIASVCVCVCVLFN